MMDYKSAGVDIEAGYRSVELMKAYVAKTMRPEVMGGLGGFSGAFSLAKIKEMDDPVLLSGTDGVGTKLKLAFLMDRHDTVGIDCVAMCVNDVACAGGEPLFFLDYIACGKNYPEKIAQIVKGVCDGCEQAGAALIGGETAEMPGFYPVDEYDLAGFAVGAADKKNLITAGGQSIVTKLCNCYCSSFALFCNIVKLHNFSIFSIVRKKDCHIIRCYLGNCHEVHVVVLIENYIVVYSKKLAIKIVGSYSRSSYAEYLYLLCSDDRFNRIIESFCSKESVCSLYGLNTGCTDIVGN